MSIPKVIHQIWIQGENNLPAKFNNNIKTIKDIHDKWQYYLWDERDILELIKNDKDLINKYYKFTYLHQKVDFAKIIILYNYGGIYIDIDAYTNKNLDDLFTKYEDYDFIISDLKDIGVISNLSICRNIGKCYNNGIFISKKKADILKYMIDNFETECSFIDSKIQCIQKTTGPYIFNKIINKYIKSDRQDKSKIKILDYEYLEPCTMDMCDITNNTYIVHKHENSWINNTIKSVMHFYVKYFKLINIVLCIILFLVLFFLCKISIYNYGL
jgi:mannosyltransferase OCH1-like enzyme